MSHHLDPRVFELEKKLINPKKWEKYLDKFPDDIRKDLEYVIRWDKGLEENMPPPIGMGYSEDVGWFCLAAGQGPFLVWSEKELVT